MIRLSTGRVWLSAAVAGFFGWHPLHVESVAWITERKDVLSTFFWMLAMLAYVKYAQQVEGRGKAWKFYVLTILFFVLGLMSKPMVVTLPCVLLLWDFWPLRRLVLVSQKKLSVTQEAAATSPGVAPGQVSSPSPGSTALAESPSSSFQRLVLEKAPLFLLALAAGIWTALAMHEGTAPKDGMSLGSRVQNGLLAAFVLLRKMIWPLDLAPYYPVDPKKDVTAEAVMAGAFLLFCTFLIYGARHKKPYLLVGWLWYLGTLILVVLRLQSGSFTWADRYAHVPMIGITIIVVWGLCDRMANHPAVCATALSGLLLTCAALTWQQVKIWRDSESLWTHTLEVTDPEINYMAHFDLAHTLRENNRLEEALPHFQEAVNILPRNSRFRMHLAQVHLDLARKLRYQQPGLAREHLLQAWAGFSLLMAKTPYGVIPGKYAETQALLEEIQP